MTSLDEFMMEVETIAIGIQKRLRDIAKMYTEHLSGAEFQKMNVLERDSDTENGKGRRVCLKTFKGQLSKLLKETIDPLSLHMCAQSEEWEIVYEVLWNLEIGRKQKMTIPGGKIPKLQRTLRSVVVNPSFRNQGIFNATLEVLKEEKDIEGIYIEAVVNMPLLLYLINKGYSFKSLDVYKSFTDENLEMMETDVQNRVKKKIDEKKNEDCVHSSGLSIEELLERALINPSLGLEM